MKVTRNTPDLLIFSHTPWGTGTLIITFALLFIGSGVLIIPEAPVFGFVFGGIGGAISWGGFKIFVRRQNAVFDRKSNHVCISSRSTSGSKTIKYTLNNIRAVVVSEKTIKGVAQRPLFHQTISQKHAQKYPINKVGRRPELVLHDKTRVPIREDFINDASAQIIANQIRRWLGNPPKS